jgi:hypothetical protein
VAKTTYTIKIQTLREIAPPVQAILRAQGYERAAGKFKRTSRVTRTITGAVSRERRWQARGAENSRRFRSRLRAFSPCEICKIWLDENLRITPLASAVILDARQDEYS